MIPLHTNQERGVTSKRIPDLIKQLKPPKIFSKYFLIPALASSLALGSGCTVGAVALAAQQNIQSGKFDTASNVLLIGGGVAIDLIAIAILSPSSSSTSVSEADELHRQGKANEEMHKVQMPPPRLP